MRVEKVEYVCNICGETEFNCSELLTIDMDVDGDGDWHELISPDDADTHICRDCFVELTAFWRGRDEEA